MNSCGERSGEREEIGESGAVRVLKAKSGPGERNTVGCTVRSAVRSRAVAERVEQKGVRIDDESGQSCASDGGGALQRTHEVQLGQV